MTRYSRKRIKQYVHFLTEASTVTCNPRDRESAHRAEVENIATENINLVTCKKCWNLIWRSGKYRNSNNK